MIELRIPSPLHPLEDRDGVRIMLKRDDLIHPDFPGNKWRKLKHNIPHDRGQVLTFGGAFSNHIQATAAAGHHFGFPTVGVIRGEERVNPVLAAAADFGMRLTYVSRTSYREKSNPSFIAALHDEFGDFTVIPEGGANPEGVRGCAELVAEIDADFDVICCSCGTGTTLAGVASALPAGRRALGFSVLRGGAFLTDDVRRLQPEDSRNWAIETEFDFGGFARRDSTLDAFISDFRDEHDITLNWVYEAKMMYGLYALIARGRFEPGTTVIAVLA